MMIHRCQSARSVTGFGQPTAFVFACHVVDQCETHSRTANLKPPVAVCWMLVKTFLKVELFCDTLHSKASVTVDEIR